MKTPKAMRRMRPPLLSSRVRNTSRARAPRLARYVLPLAGESWGEGEAPNGGARPSSGRFATAFPRMREKGMRQRRSPAFSSDQWLGAPPLAGEGWGEGNSSCSLMGPAPSSMTHLAKGVAPVAADGVAAVMPALGLADSASGPSDSILRPMESVFGWASGRSGALTI